jgi:hypothetical protein
MANIYSITLINSKSFVATIATTLFVLSQTILCSSALAVAPTEYEIPLSELRQIAKKKSQNKSAARVVKPKITPPVKVSKRSVLPVDSSLWATLESVHIIDEGVRIDIDDFKGKFKVLLEPLNKKIILQFVGVDYPSGNIKLPLGANGFVQARIGRHIDGIWVVLDTADYVFPNFKILQNSDGISLKTSDDDDLDEGEELLSDGETEPVRISHIPFSFIVAEKETLIKAVINSKNEVKEVYSVVKTAKEGKPVLILMSKSPDTLYTYEGRLPEQPLNGQALRYSIVARDVLDNKTRSIEFLTPVTSSPLVPGWQQ